MAKPKGRKYLKNGFTEEQWRFIKSEAERLDVSVMKMMRIIVQSYKEHAKNQESEYFTTRKEKQDD